VTTPRGQLIAVDGVNGQAVRQTSRALARTARRQRAAVSTWDASGIFTELTLAEEEAGRPSARTLLLLYAADLAFRLRWEISPALEEGRTVIAAQYVNTAVAFGCAAGLDAATVVDLFAFAPAADETRIVHEAVSRELADGYGFVEFACHHVFLPGKKAQRRDLRARARRALDGITPVLHDPPDSGRRRPAR